ncbi:hypothetical protein D3C71_1471790 [compost metagenome]
MIQLSQFDLQFAFVSARALGENVENQASAVQHPALENPLQIAFLTGREDVVEDHQIRLENLDLIAQLLDLATANQVFRSQPVTRHAEKGNRVSTGRDGQFLKLLRIFARRGVLTFQMNQNSPLTPFMALEEQYDLLDQALPGSASASSVSETLGKRTGRLGTTVEIACL